MLIRLEHRNVSLYDVDADEIDRDIEIGRSRQCGWVVPAEEKTVSGRHAVITREGQAIWIKDLDSANGTFCRGKRIARMKLKPGVQLSIGGCALIAEAGAQAKARLAIPEIAVLSGKGRGLRREVKPPKLTIGSDPQCGLVFLDPLVSHSHAEILVKDDGGCWLRDLGSKNGTSVNGVPLRQGQERLLKEGDKIAFAHLEAAFHDGAQRRPKLRVWLRVGIMAATAALVIGAYAGYQWIRPSAKASIASARRAATAEDFAAVRALLDRASGARGADASRLEMEDLTRLAGQWERTLARWSQAKSEMEQADWVNAARSLGELAAFKQDAWTWSAQAVDEREAMARAKAMLDALLHANGLLKRDDAPFDAVTAEQEKVRALQADGGAEPLAYLARLRTELAECEGRLGAYLAEGMELERAVDSLRAWPPPVPEVEAVLEKTLRASKGALRRRCELLQKPVRALGACYAQYQAALGDVKQMKFEAALQVDMRLPEAGLCALDSRVSTARGNLETGFERLRTQTSQLMYLFREVNKFMAEGRKLPDAIAAWENVDALEKVFACDALDLPMPRRSRAEPAGEYDRYLGIEEFHEFLLAIVLGQQWSGKPTTPFLTLLFQSENIVGAIQNIQSFFEKQDWATRLTPVNDPFAAARLGAGGASSNPPPAAAEGGPAGRLLLEGPLAARVAELKAVLAARDVTVNRMLEIAKAEAGRTAIIAAGVAYRLAVDPKKLAVGGEGLEPWIAKRMEASRGAIRDLGREYDLSGPERQVELRDRILTEGLPGDPVVRRMWSSRGASQ